jgi:WD40 repeat protein
MLLVVVTFAWPASSRAAGPPPKERFDLYGDPLPAGAIARLGTLRWRHLEGFHNPVLSPDGRWLVSSKLPPSRKMSLYVWEVATGRLWRTLGSQDLVGDWPFGLFAFLPDGKSLLSHDQEKGTFALWDFPSFRLVKRWPGVRVDSLAVSPDGRLAAGTYDSKVSFFNLRTGKWHSVDVIRGERDLFHALAFTPDGCLVLMRSRHAKTTRIPRYLVFRVDLRTRRICHQFEFSSESAKLAPDGQHVATCDQWGAQWLYRVDTGKKYPLPMRAQRKWASNMAFNRDGRRLVMVDHEANLAWTWDVERGELLDRVRLSRWLGWYFAFPAISLTDQTWLDGTVDALTRVSLRRGNPERSPAGLYHPAESLRWSADGRSIVVEAEHHHVRWYAATGRVLAEGPWMSHHKGPGDSEAWAYSPDGVCFAVGTGKTLHKDEASRGWISLFDARNGAFLARNGKFLEGLQGHNSRVSALGFNSTSRVLASVDEAGMIRLWNMASGRVKGVINASKVARNVTGVLFSPDSRRLVLVEKDGRLHLWDIRTGMHTRTLRPKLVEAPRDADKIQPLGVFSLEGRRLFVYYGGQLYAWDLAAGREMGPFAATELGDEEHPWQGGRAGLSISGDGRFLARLESGLWLYEVASGKVIHRLPGLCTAAAFHPSRLQLAAANETRLDTLIWDLKALFLSLPCSRPDKPTLHDLWADLAHRDPGRAYRAVSTLADTPGMECFLSRHLKPMAPLDRDWCKRQIAELGSDDFATRQKAEMALIPVAEAAANSLRQAHQSAADLEQRQRLQRLLDRLLQVHPDRVREHRAVFALEMRGTSEARRLLGLIAGGMPGARRTEEARAALRQLDTTRTRTP